MTRKERMDVLRDIIDQLGAMGYPRAARAVILELAAEYGATIEDDDFEDLEVAA